MYGYERNQFKTLRKLLISVMNSGFIPTFRARFDHWRMTKIRHLRVLMSILTLHELKPIKYIFFNCHIIHVCTYQKRPLFKKFQ